MCAFEKCCFLIKIRTGLILFSTVTLISGVALIASGGSNFQGDLQSIVSIVSGICLFLESIIILLGAITRHHIVLLVSLCTTAIVLLLLIIVGTILFTITGTDQCQQCMKMLNSSNFTKSVQKILQKINTSVVEESILTNDTTISNESYDGDNLNLGAMASFFIIFSLFHGYMLCIKYSFYLVLANTNRTSNTVELVPTF